jgi:CxxC-x17-CxxC domain-containing protein
MGKFDRGGFGGGKKFGGRDRSFDRNAPRQMYKATCAECGDECEVPFKPSGDRPVLCSICFKQSGRGEERGERRDDRREERRDFDRPRNDDKRMFDATCAECGQHCQVPFQPKPGRDIFCSDCFGREDRREQKSFTSEQAPKSFNYDKHFEALHAKLDRLIALLAPKAPVAVQKPVEAAVKKEVVAPIAKAEVKKEKKAEKNEEKKDEKKVLPKKKVSKKK